MDTSGIARTLNEWFSRTARPLPWRDPQTSAWAILVSEFMLQQTQVERVIPRWISWLERWPTPASLAADAPGEAVRAWDRLGYPRRALWLHRAAVEITEQHGGQVPSDIDKLLALTGVGPYTARAVATFAYGERHPVVDTNTRRVIARLVHGRAAAGMPAASDLTDMAALLPEDDQAAAQFNAAAMELGATVCVARTPRCDSCPLATWCEWRGAGYPENAPEKRPTQARFEGSDRQARGRVLAALRGAPTGTAVSRTMTLLTTAGGASSPHRPTTPLAPDAIDAALDQLDLQLRQQAERAIESLVRDGLIVAVEDTLRLP